MGRIGQRVVSRPLVIAHRGASDERAENTLPAFERAIELGADMIETDLHLTRDGVVVIHHDAALQRLGESGEIRDRTGAELATLDAAPHEISPQPIPTLLDLLEGFASRIDFNLELKTGLTSPYVGLEEQVLAAVDERGLSSKMLFSCFDVRVLERVRTISSTARIALLVSPRDSSAILDHADRVGAEAINPHCSLVSVDSVQAAHEAGFAVYPYTANEPAEMNRLLDCGVDGVITNFPKRLRDLVEERESAAG